MRFTHAPLKVSLLERVRKQIPFFRDFGLEELRTILRNCQQASYPSGFCIIQEGEISDNMYVVIQGEVQVSRTRGGAEEILCSLEAGECFGEMGIIEKTRRSATVRAKSDCLLLAVSGAILNKVNPMFASRLFRNISSILSERLRNTSGLVEKLQAEKDEFGRRLARLEGENQELKSRVEELEAQPQLGGYWGQGWKKDM